MLDDGEVFGELIRAHPAVIVAEDHVEDPVEEVFDTPIVSMLV